MSPKSPDSDAAETEGGDRGARLEAIWRRHLPELVRRSLAWTSGRHEDAEDALGRAALAAVQGLPRSLAPAQARSWLLRLVYTKCMDIYRERKRAAGRLAGDLDRAAGHAAALPGPEERALAAELCTFIAGSIHRLPPRLRAAAHLHLVGDLPYAEIAARLGITEANARKRIQQARTILRRHYRERP